MPLSAVHRVDERLARAVNDLLGTPVIGLARLSGGDVARAYRVQLADGTPVFAKTHDAPPPGFFLTEAAGLRWLRDAHAVAVPEVLAVQDGGGSDAEGPLALLVLEWIDEAPRANADDAELGRQLARLHLTGATCFGREDARPTGSRSLPNPPTSTWAEFYAECRLLPLVRLARDADALSATSLDALERIAADLGRFGAADEPPARLHGDLWAGNRLVDRHGRSWLIDPAAHGGHREFDLAMMRLFGGFGPAAFAAYDEVHPLAEGWRDRVPLHQLAPLMVHAIKFGGGYRAATEQAIAELRA